ncbi:MAG: type II toxin-antitoxin system VapC family toxin [Deltaproteobacteria bacterium]|nr:type II toxin-antitoxin system VapC family toxin [Deltaproteobacteria bacterium]
MVFDTNVFAYALLNVPEHRDEALRSFEKARDIVVPDSFRVEIANTVWQWTRARGLDLEAGLSALREAEALVGAVVPANHLWEAALELSVANGHPVYDTFFVALAAMERTRVVTYDKRLLARFPERAISVAAFLKER